MIENTNTKQFYPGPILNNTLEITDFLFNDAEQIKIKHSKLNEEGILIDVDLNYPTDYEVIKVLPSDINAAEAALTASTGQIMLKNVNVLAGERLTVYRVSQIIQDKDYPRTGAFPAATHEGALDYLTMQNQEQKDEIDRALKVPISTQNFEGSLPLPIPARALKINNDGTGFEMSEFDPDLALVTTEEFKNQSQQAAAEALASEIAAANSAAGAKASENTATNKATEVVELGTTAVNNINEAYNFVNEWFRKLNAIPYIPVGTILPTTGAIDESLGYQRYANGQLIANVSSQAPDLVKFLEFQEAHAPNLLCSETEWQTALTLSTLGQVGKYVWNKEEDTIRIPRIVNIQGMVDMNTVGNIVEAGLPNITAAVNSRGVSQSKVYGSLYKNSTANNAISVTEKASGVTTGQIDISGSAVSDLVTFDASLSNPIYGNSNTVQEESILYPYVLQIATGVQYKTPVINEIELNNPFSLLDYKYSEYELNNISWLRSNGQYNSKAIYPAVYDLLLEIYNGTETKAGVSVKLSTETFTDYDFVLNTAEETFRLPLLNGSEDLPSDRYIDLELLTSGSTYTAPANGFVFLEKLNTSNTQFVKGINISSGYADISYGTYSGSTPNILLKVKRGDTFAIFYDAAGALNVFRFTYAQGNGSLYFYVGETVQNANLINAGRIEEKIASLVPDNSSLITSYAMPSMTYEAMTTGASGAVYTAPANGYFVARGQTNSENNNHSMIWVLMQADGTTELSWLAQQSSPTPAVEFSVIVPAGKNCKYKLLYGRLSSVNVGFIYAQGSESEAQ